MREILFRGKTYDGKWEQGDLRHGGYVHNDSESYIMRTDYALHNIPVDPKTIGQYTGLTDKNGTKIFEGDIVTIFLKDGTEKGYIKYRDAGCRFQFIDKYSIGYNIDNTTDFEVIGNIHDNPELLGGEGE